MLQRKVILFLCVAIVYIHNLSFAQSTHKKAEKYFEQALNLYKANKTQKALIQLQKAEKFNPTMAKIFLLRADIYADSKADSLSIISYQKAIDLEPDSYQSAYKFIAHLQYNNGKYQASKDAMQHYLSYILDHQDSSKIQAAKQHLKYCDFALNQIAKAVEFTPKNLGDSINTNYSEYFPCPNMYQNSLWFTRCLEENKHIQEDFFVSHQKAAGGSWELASALPAPINSPFNEGAASLSADGTLLVFAACEMETGGYGNHKEGFGSCDLFWSQYTNGKWTAPQNMGAHINTSLWESQPSLSADGKNLYFIRATNRSKKNTDIYTTSRLPNGDWTKAKPLPKYINTPKEEMSVMIHPNNCVLYFASKGHMGMGRSDIFICRRANSMAKWSQPQNLGYPINTYKDENGLQVSHDGKTAFFASDRAGGYGGMDIYSFQLPKDKRATAVSYLNIKVIDAETQQPIQAQLQLTSHHDSSQKISTKTNDKGLLFATFSNNTTYAVAVSKTNYLFYSDSIALLHSPSQTYQKTIALTPIKVGERLKLNNIFFDTNDSHLKTESYAELQNIKRFLVNNPNMRIRIEGHTDNNGTVAYNQKLSEARAKAVHDYLISQHIDNKRIAYAGYGETQAVADNSTAEGRRQNRRIEFVILSNTKQ